jgi:hypothetical protein
VNVFYDAGSLSPGFFYSIRTSATARCGKSSGDKMRLRDNPLIENKPKSRFRSIKSRDVSSKKEREQQITMIEEE